MRTVLIAITAALLIAGCATPDRIANPSFPVTRRQAESDLRRMQAAPVQAERPIVFLAGIGDPSVSSGALRRAIMPGLEAAIAEVDFFDEVTFPGARQKLLREVAEQLHADINNLPEVDVVAFSMGGLVARETALADDSGRRLPIRRLFTIATPHQGARLAGIPIGTPIGDDMIPTSEFLEHLRTAAQTYELYCYTRLDDVTVGEEFAAPEGVALWWIPTPSGEWAHAAAFDDARIQADIARRLRGEAPFSTLPAAPLPD